MGLLLIGDLLTRIADLTEFYTDGGVLPRYALIQQFSNPWILSPMNAIGHASLVFVYMLAALATYIAFLVGYRTRLATFLSWVFFCSFSARNTAIAHGGDDLLRLSLFWAQFLRLDTRWAVHKNPNVTPSPLASFAFISQLLVMYLASALLKWHPVWHTEGSAVYYALHLDAFTTSLGQWLSKGPLWLLKILTFATFSLELVGPWIWLLAFQNWKARLAILTSFIIFHIGLIFTLELGPFPYACIVYWMALLPEEVWKELSYTFPKYRDYFRSNFVMEDSYKKKDFRRSFKNSFILSCWGIAMAWNIATFSESDAFQLLPATYRAGNILRLHQKWEMFAPFPKKGDGWIMVDAKLFNDDHWDILNDRPISFDKPDNLSKDMVDTLWRKYLINLSTVTFKDYLPHFNRWLCHDWNASHRETRNKAIHLEVWMLGERTPPPGQIPQPLEKLKIADHYCIE